MIHTKIEAKTILFLKELANHNEREWFSNHKNDYLQAQQNMADFADALILEMNEHDVLEDKSGKKCLYRIYKDARFSKEKIPYNTHFSFSLQRATKQRRGGYYLKIKPGQSFLGCGFFAPESADLMRIRQDISANYEDWNALLSLDSIVSRFGEIQGQKVSTVPRGFSKENPAINLLRYKQFYFSREFSDEEVLSSDFLQIVNNSFKTIRPFFDYMSEVLVTNVDGEEV